MSKKKKVKMEKHCPKCGNPNLTYWFYESALGIKGSEIICEECGFTGDVD